MSNRFSRWIVIELFRPITWIGSVVGRIYDLLFKERDVRRSKQGDDRLADEIRRDLPFLFTEYNGVVLTDQTAQHPRPFDFAGTIIALSDLQFRFFRGRGDMLVQVAPRHAPNDWEDLLLVLALIDDEFRPKPFLFWTDVGSVLGSRMHRLREAFSENNYPELKERLLDMHQYERAAIKQWQTEINRKLHSD